MRIAGRCLLLALVLGGCGSNGGGSNGSNNVTGSVDDGGANPGDEAGAPGRRGGGGPFGGGSESDGAAPSPDGSASSLDGAAAPTDTKPKPDQATTPAPDSAPASPDVGTAGPDVASAPDTGTAGSCTNGVCTAYETEYKEALVRARVCSVGGKGQCLMQVPNALRCGCATWVNTAVELDGIRAKWMDSGCASCTRYCPLIACPALTSSVCNPRRLMMGAGDIVPPPADLGVCSDTGGPTP
jgi:hypothetical protein